MTNLSEIERDQNPRSNSWYGNLGCISTAPSSYCFLCYIGHEDRYRLFFECPYSTSILERLYEPTGNGLVDHSRRLMDILNKVNGFHEVYFGV